MRPVLSLLCAGSALACYTVQVDVTLGSSSDDSSWSLDEVTAEYTADDDGQSFSQAICVENGTFTFDAMDMAGDGWGADSTMSVSDPYTGAYYMTPTPFSLGDSQSLPLEVPLTTAFRTQVEVSITFDPSENSGSASWMFAEAAKSYTLANQTTDTIYMCVEAGTYDFFQESSATAGWGTFRVVDVASGAEYGTGTFVDGESLTTQVTVPELTVSSDGCQTDLPDITADDCSDDQWFDGMFCVADTSSVVEFDVMLDAVAEDFTTEYQQALINAIAAALGVDASSIWVLDFVNSDGHSDQITISLRIVTSATDSTTVEDAITADAFSTDVAASLATSGYTTTVTADNVEVFTEEDDSNDDDDSDDDGSIGIIIGVVLGVVALAVAGFVWHSKNRGEADDPNRFSEMAKI